MVKFIETVLGREVTSFWEEWKDIILYVLHKWHRDPFNKQDVPITSERIIEELLKEGYEDISQIQVNDICKKFKEENLVEQTQNDFYRISPQGVEYVEKLLTKIR